MKYLKKTNNPFLEGLPYIDLHGCDRDYSRYKVKEFVYDNYTLGNKKIVVIHGIGEGIVKDAVHEYLRNDERVIEYKLDNFNTGMTIVILK